jgi:hypothetical protein
LAADTVAEHEDAEECEIQRKVCDESQAHGDTAATLGALNTGTLRYFRTKAIATVTQVSVATTAIAAPTAPKRCARKYNIARFNAPAQIKILETIRFMPIAIIV